MSDQPTSLFSTGPGRDTGAGPGPGLGGANTQPIDRPTRRALTWNPATDLGLVLLRFAIGGVFFAHGMQQDRRMFDAAAGLIGKHIWTEFPEGVGQPFHRAYERAMNEIVPTQ